MEQAPQSKLTIPTRIKKTRRIGILSQRMAKSIPHVQDTRCLQQLSKVAGVQTWYLDVEGRRCETPPDSLLAVLRALGIPVHHLSDCADALRLLRLTAARAGVPPVVVTYGGRRDSISLRLPSAISRSVIRSTLQLENGELHRRDLRLGQLPRQAHNRVGGNGFTTWQIPLKTDFPLGYHRATFETSMGQFESLIIAAPRTAFCPQRADRGWGIFLPLYALHSNSSAGGGDFRDLRELMEWTARQGGALVGTLPLLPAFLDEPFETSPYLPVSRLMWNEFYLDLTSVAEVARCPKARAILNSTAYEREIKTLRAAPLLDYRRQWAVKRKVLQVLAESFFARNTDQHTELRRFLNDHPLVADYACFRAAVETQRNGWRQWPERMRSGELLKEDYSAATYRCYLYAQWQAHRQMAALSRNAEHRGVQLYLDLPLGVHPDGFDAWCHRDVFAVGARGGAPPDLVFTKGQEWGFAPLHPGRLRASGYRYFIAVLRHHLRHTGMLRIDHIMALHRLYWIPRGRPANKGAYVTYPAKDLYAILSLESQRHQAMIVGENLGTVPPEVNRTMIQHRLREMYVMQYEMLSMRRGALRRVPARSVASLNTHDMPPFKAFWQALDIADRRSLGLLRQTQIHSEQQRRQETRNALVHFLRSRGWLRKPAENPNRRRGEAKPLVATSHARVISDATGSNEEIGAILEACLLCLARGPADVVLLNLEDLWLETEPQNTPGTRNERVNWRRKAGFTLEKIEQIPELEELLRKIDSLRRGNGPSAKSRLSKNCHGKPNTETKTNNYEPSRRDSGNAPK